MARTVVRSSTGSVFSNAAVIGRTEMSSSVREPSIGHDRRPLSDGLVCLWAHNTTSFSSVLRTQDSGACALIHLAFTKTKRNINSAKGKARASLPAKL